MLASDEVLLLLGGNVGDPLSNLNAAEVALELCAGRIIARSRDHWTEPVGFIDDRLFLNRALILRTELEPLAVLHCCTEVERQGGRERVKETRNMPRTIDVDILLYGIRVLDVPTLTVPHPRFHERAFALGPAADISPDSEIPGQMGTILQLLNSVRKC